MTSYNEAIGLNESFADVVVHGHPGYAGDCKHQWTQASSTPKLFGDTIYRWFACDRCGILLRVK